MFNMQTKRTWTALAAASLALGTITGCKQEPVEVADVPPPPETYEPAPLPPVTIDQGDTDWQAGEPGAAGPQVDPVPVAPPPPVGGQQTYTVRKGDTLWSIATRVYGDGQKWVDIAQANPTLDPQKMAVGQQIVLP